MGDPEVPEETYDVDELPKFAEFRKALERQCGQIPGAVDTWIGKLEGWCREAQEEIGRQTRRAENLIDKVSDYESELADARAHQERIDELEEKIADLDRGLISTDELQEAIR